MRPVLLIGKCSDGGAETFRMSHIPAGNGCENTWDAV